MEAEPGRALRFIGKLVYPTWQVQEFESAYLQNTKSKVENTRGTPEVDLWLPHHTPPGVNVPLHSMQVHIEKVVIAHLKPELTVQLKNMQKLLVLKPESQQ